MSDDTTTSSELATVAGELYGALLEARPHLVRMSDLADLLGCDELLEQVSAVLDRADAVLADGADYLEAVAL